MIAYLLKKFPRLSETFVLNEILQQERLGRRIHVFSRREPDDEPSHPELASLAAEVEVLPYRGPFPDLWKLLFDPDDDHPIELATLRPAVLDVIRFGRKRTTRLLTEAAHLRDRCDALGVRHVHVHFATDSAVTALLLRELGGPTYSVTAHAKDIYRSTVDPRLLGRVVERSEFTVTVCDANVDYLRERLPAPAAAKLRRLYNGIDLASFSSPGEERVAGSILAVGRLVPKKGFDVLLRALAILRDRGIAFDASIVGQGEEDERLRSLAAELGLADAVEFTGPLPLDAIRGRLARASVFALPCRIDADGNRDALPTVLLEALAAGVPSVSTRVAGVSEILDRGRVGELVSPDDPQAIATSIERLLGDAELCASYARRGREWAAENFDGARAARTLGSWFDAVRSVRRDPSADAAAIAGSRPAGGEG